MHIVRNTFLSLNALLCVSKVFSYLKYGQTIRIVANSSMLTEIDVLNSYK